MFPLDIPTLAVFLTAVLVLFMSPGPNMALVLSASLGDGPRAGIVAALGIAAADVLLLTTSRET